MEEYSKQKKYHIKLSEKTEFMRRFKFYFLTKHLILIISILFISFCVLFSLFYEIEIKEIKVVFILSVFGVLYQIILVILSYKKTSRAILEALSSDISLSSNKIYISYKDYTRQISLTSHHTIINSTIGTIIITGEHNVSNLNHHSYPFSLKNETQILIPIITKDYDELIAAIKTANN